METETLLLLSQTPDACTCVCVWGGLAAVVEERGWRKCNEGEGRESLLFPETRKRERENHMDKEGKRTTLSYGQTHTHTHTSALMHSRGYRCC